MALILGRNGDDILAGTRRGDLVIAGGGDDSVAAGDGNDIVLGGAGSDSLAGEGGRDRLYGGSGEDSVVGGDGADQLFGGGGNDVLSGGADGNTLWGGAGSDQFLFDTSDSYLPTMAGRDFQAAYLAVAGDAVAATALIGSLLVGAHVDVIKDFDSGDGAIFQASNVPDGGFFNTTQFISGVDGDGDGSFDDFVGLDFFEVDGVNIYFKAVVIEDYSLLAVPT